jgi:hypothetical protein
MSVHGRVIHMLRTTVLALGLFACGGSYVAGVGPNAVCPGCDHGAFVAGSKLEIETSWEGSCHSESPSGPFPTPGGDFKTSCERVSHTTKVHCPKAPCTFAGTTVTATGPGELLIEVELASSRGKRTRTLGPYQIRNPTSVQTICRSTSNTAEVHVDLYDQQRSLEFPGVLPRVNVKGTFANCPVIGRTARMVHYQCTEGLGLDKYDLPLEVHVSPSLTLEAIAHCA